MPRPTAFPLDPSLPLPSPSPTLPEHIIHHIATCADELSIWRMMATSRAFRHAAEPALKPYLAKQVVVSQPAPFETVPTPLDSISSHLAVSHQRKLRSIAAKLDAHLLAYPPAQSYLRDLTVDVRDDDRQSGWELLRRCGRQLERLDLRVFDDAQASTTSGVGALLATLSRTYHSSLAWMWPTRLMTSTGQFESLVVLRLSSTARILEHLSLMSTSFPNLRELTVNSNIARMELNPVVNWARRLPKLERLAISGPTDCPEKFLCLTTNIRYLIYSAPSRPSVSSGLPIMAVLHETNRMRGLKGLALYGSGAHNFAKCAWLAQDVGDRMRVAGQRGLPNITSLVLERVTEEAGSSSCYELLQKHGGLCPDLPDLVYLTYIDKRLDARGEVRARALSTSVPSSRPIYAESDLRKLFERYPSLEYVQWLNDYPSDPFADTSPLPTSVEPNLICRVLRPHGKDDPLVRFGPYVPPAQGG